MAYFPFMIDIENKDCLIVGGGKVAYRKAMDLQCFGADITVISTEFCQELMELSGIQCIEKEYETNDIEGRFIVIAATNDRKINMDISKECVKRQILVNAVDIKEACTFIFPAIVKKDDLVVSVSTGGNSPAGAAYLKEKIEKSIPENYEKNIEFLGTIRDKIINKISDAKRRKKMFYDLLKQADVEQKILNEEDISNYIKSL